MKLKMESLSSMLEVNNRGEAIIDGGRGDIFAYPVALKEKTSDGATSFKFGFGITKFNEPIHGRVDEAAKEVIEASDDERASLIILTGTTDKLRRMGKALIRMAGEMDKIK